MAWETDTWDNTTIVYSIVEGFDNIHSSSKFSIPALNTLTINPGMKIKLGYEDDVRVNGKLTVAGTITDPIYFSSTKDDTLCGVGAFDEAICDTNSNGASMGTKGDWGHIVFNAGSDDDSIISRAVVRYSGRDNDYFGIDDGAIFLTNASPELSFITFTDNYINGVEINDVAWETDTWDNTTVMYVIEEGDVTVKALNTLVIETNMKIKLNDDADIRVDGKLVAIGTITNPIYFSSVKDDDLCGIGAFDENICDTHNDGLTLPGVGNWGAVIFNSGSDDSSIISRAVIRYSGSTSGSAIDDGAIYFYSNASPQLSYITFTGNYINGVEIQDGNWTTGTWDNTTVVYVIEQGDVTIPALNTLTIVPGAKIKLNTRDSINVNGKLVAAGTSEEPIYFSSWADDTVCGTGAFGEPICDTHNDGATAGVTGHWGNLNFGSGSDETSLVTRAVIRYAGNDGGGLNDGAVRLNDVSPSISYSSLLNNYRGIEALNGATPTLVCNDIHHNTHFGIYNNTPATPVVAEGHWWGDASGPTHPTNPGGTGQSVSDGVDFTPWQTASCTIPSLQLTKQVNTNMAKPNDILTYTLTLVETSGNGNVNTKLSDPIPANTSYIPGSAQITSPSSGILTDTGSKVEWSGTIAANSAVELTFQVAVTGSLNNDTSVVNEATYDNGQGTLLTRAVTTTVDATPPTTLITAPPNGKVITSTTTYIAGLATDTTSGIDRIELSTNNGSSWSQVGDSSPWSYLWLVPTEDGVKHTLKARSLDKAGNLESTSVVTVTVDNMPPVSQINNLANGQILTGTTYIIHGTAADGSGIAQVEISTDDGNNWQIVTGTTQWAYTWTLPTDADLYTVLVRATDNSGHVEDAADGITVNVQPSVGESASQYTFLPIILK